MLNELIVWDEDNKCFQYDISVCRGYAFIIGGEIIKNATFHNYIGKTDIDGNKIYAGSSIVEFDYIYIETIGKQSDKVKVKGYFTFNNDSLAYDLNFFHNWIDYMPNYWINQHMEKEDIKRASNFKIIDTLQENKLGLRGD